MTVSSMIQLPGPVGGKYAFDDPSNFDDGSTWDDIGGSVLANTTGRSAPFPDDDAIRPSLLKVAQRMVRLGS